MKSQLFREKSLERVSSPEQLNDYIRVANPSVWLALAAVVLLLMGICVWGVFGRLDTVVTVGAITEGDRTVCYVKEADLESVATGMKVWVGEDVYEVSEIALQPVQVTADFPEYLAHVGGIAQGEWVYEVELDGVLGADGGIYEAQIVIESISPMSFVIN